MLSRSYETIFERALGEVALAATDLDVPLAPFWPVRGAAYEGSLLMIGSKRRAKARTCGTYHARTLGTREEATTKVPSTSYGAAGAVTPVAGAWGI